MPQRRASGYGIEKLFHMPALGVIAGQGIDLIAIGGGEESIKGPILRPLALTLNELVVGTGLAVGQLVG